MILGVSFKWKHVLTWYLLCHESPKLVNKYWHVVILMWYLSIMVLNSPSATLTHGVLCSESSLLCWWTCLCLCVYEWMDGCSCMHLFYKRLFSAGLTSSQQLQQLHLEADDAEWCQWEANVVWYAECFNHLRVNMMMSSVCLLMQLICCLYLWSEWSTTLMPPADNSLHNFQQTYVCGHIVGECRLQLVG